MAATSRASRRILMVLFLVIVFVLAVAAPASAGLYQTHMTYSVVATIPYGDWNGAEIRAKVATAPAGTSMIM